MPVFRKRYPVLSLDDANDDWDRCAQAAILGPEAGYPVVHRFEAKFSADGDAIVTIEVEADERPGLFPHDAEQSGVEILGWAEITSDGRPLVDVYRAHREACYAAAGSAEHLGVRDHFLENARAWNDLAVAQLIADAAPCGPSPDRDVSQLSGGEGQQPEDDSIEESGGPDDADDESEAHAPTGNPPGWWLAEAGEPLGDPGCDPFREQATAITRVKS